MADTLNLRDKFALAFVVGAQSNAEAWLDADALAERAYAVADAMIARRAATNTEPPPGESEPPGPDGDGHGGHS